MTLQRRGVQCGFSSRKVLIGFFLPPIFSCVCVANKSKTLLSAT